jgi:hypothetical protein
VDLTVDGAHSFFVGSGQVLVHNCNIGQAVAEHSFGKRFGFPTFTGSSVKEWGQFVEDALHAPGVISRPLANGRTAFWNDRLQMVINPRSCPPLGWNGHEPFAGHRLLLRAEVTTDDRLLKVIRRRESAYWIEMSANDWVGASNTLNEFVNGLRIDNYVADVGASLDDLELALGGVGHASRSAAGRVWEMTLAGERALEAALSSMSEKDWLDQYEFHPRVGVDREVVAHLFVDLVRARTGADRAFCD